MLYSDVEAFLKAQNFTEKPVFDPGPFSDARLQDKSSQALVFIQVGNGPGLTTESVFDQKFVTIHTYGRQGSYASAEKLANDIDQVFLRIDRPTTMGTARVLWASRTGGAPAVVDMDSADRYHFSCTYVVEAPTAPLTEGIQDVQR